jgi:hypothetical protein
MFIYNNALLTSVSDFNVASSVKCLGMQPEKVTELKAVWIERVG